MKTPTIVNMMFGSHLYGLNTPQSDIDYKGIYMPTLEELLLCTYPKTTKTSTGPKHDKNNPGDVDTEVISLPKFVDMGIKGETMVLDMLHCNEPLVTSPIWESLVANRTMFYSRNLKAFVGYVKRQAAKYGVKGSRLSDINQAMECLLTLSYGRDSDTLTLRDVWDDLYEGEYAKKVYKTGSNGQEQQFYVVNDKMYQDTVNAVRTRHMLLHMYTQYGHRAKQAEKNEGVDWKAVSHALRAAYQARDIYRDGDFQYPLRERNFLLAVKQGNLDYKTDVASVLEDLVDEVSDLTQQSTLPETVDTAFWHDWLIQVYEKEFGITVRR